MSQIILDVLRLNGVEFEKCKIDSMGEHRLRELDVELKSAIRSIKDQLDDARGDYAQYGVSADWDWYKMAKASKRILARWQDYINGLVRERRSVGQRGWEQVFIDVCKEMYPTAWDAIKQETQSRVEDSEWHK